MYTLGGVPEFLSEADGHRAVVYRVLVSARTASRWAEVDCSCGRTERVGWGPDTQTYRELVTAAWACVSPAFAVPR
jgi:hypothetical protein